MNLFLNRKKDKKSKSKPEPEPEINIASALPTNDDFRTSLIMPGLSTRFSMLREQDDPNSKIGKASDDSVLQPKRQSRLHEYGFVPGGLSDIAEVSSLHSRPGFNVERQNSFDSHATDQTEGGSIMNRTRPGEGNVLFGGRQKVYKISGTGSGQGRAVYDDDVHLSYFQKLKIQEKERQAAADALEHNSTAADEASSPNKDTFSPSSETFSRRRETSSSTNSGSNARSSTAATSIASQTTAPVHPPPASPTELTRNGTKGRRLYDQGLDQQMYEQQSSAMNRLNSIQRARGPNGRATPPLLYTQTRSATNLNERFINRSPALRTESPTPGLGASRDVNSNGTSPTLSRPNSPPPMSPLSPLIPETEEAKTLNTALQHQDRGKATAMGAFNKPKQAFSEEAYAERTKRMQQERDASSQKPDQSRKLTLRERAEMEKRKRAGSGETDRQRSNSPAEPKQALAAFAMFQSAATQIKSPTTAGAPQVPPKTSPSPSPSSIQSPNYQANPTFLTSAGSSDDEADAPQPVVPKPVERGRQNLPTATGPAPSILEHPALRSRSNSRPDEPFTHPALRDRSNSRSESRTSPKVEPTEPKNPDVDSPTLSGTTGGLNVLVRQHLRNVSNVSSIYDDDKSVFSPPPLQTQHVGLQRRQPASDNDSNTYSGHSHSNPWDLDDIESNPFHADRGSVSSVSPTSDMPKPRAFAMSPTSPTFVKNAEKTHQRNGSTDEHEAMQRDLAQRQRAIQQSLRAKAEGRSTSPAPQVQTGGLKSALNMLRAKSSRESFATVDTNTRKFGLGVNSNGNSSTSLVGDRKNDGPSSRRPLRLRQQSDARRDDEGRKAKSPPLSSTDSTRDRSSDELSGQSGSRPPYRDDAGQAVNEAPSERKSRSRSNSRTTAATYFESKHLQPIKTGNGVAGASPRLSPGLPASPRPSPGNPSPNMDAFRSQHSPIPAFSANNTPPISNPGTPVKAAFNPKAVPPSMIKGTLRKKSIAKSAIGEPIFLSTTSVIDTVSLADASARMSEMQQAEAAAAAVQAPPVPPINPRRRFGTGKSEVRDPAIQYGLDSPNAPFMNQTRSASSDGMSSQTTLPKQELRSAASEGKSLRGVTRRQTDAETLERDSPPGRVKMDGGMF